MKCKELMIGDWVSDKYGYLMQVTFVGNGYVSFEDNEGNLCQLDDKCNQPEPIPLTPEILEKNGWHLDTTLKEHFDSPWVYKNDKITLSLNFPSENERFAGVLGIFTEYTIRTLPGFLWQDTLYVHELQHSLRLCKLNELADNFKV